MSFQLEKNRRLSDLCTLGIGGNAQYYFAVHTSEALKAFFLSLQEHPLPYFILGKGSNCFFDDRGFQGVILHNKIDFFENLEEGIFHAGAGYSFSLLGVKTARAGFTGLEFASGIPGSVGGAVFMNAGASKQETADCLVSVDYMDESGTLQVIPKADLCFDYRSSSFQLMKGAIVGATFKLERETDARNRQLALLTYRKNTQPYSAKSAGCIFRNPQDDIPAGQLLEQEGFKGFSVGGAKVSTLHANFLINEKNASSTEMQELIALIQKNIKEKTGFSLKTEVRFIPW